MPISLGEAAAEDRRSLRRPWRLVLAYTSGPHRLCVDTRWQQLELIHFPLVNWFVVPKPHSRIESKTKP